MYERKKNRKKLNWMIFWFAKRVLIRLLYREKRLLSHPSISLFSFWRWRKHNKRRLQYSLIRVNGIEPHLPTGPIIAHNGKKKNIANTHDVSTKRIFANKNYQNKPFLNILIVIKNWPICRNDVSADNVIENPAANVVNAAIKTAEPTRDIDSVTRVSRSIWCSLYNKRYELISNNKEHILFFV